MITTVFNPNLTAEGYSADNMLRLTRDMGSKIALVRNSTKLVSMMKSVGIQTIYREAGDDPAGDPLHQNILEFVSKRMFHAPDADFVHMTNEVGFSAELDRFNLEALGILKRNNRVGIFYNASTNQSLDQWKASKNTIMSIHSNGSKIGLHIYLDGTHDDGGLDPLKLLLDWGVQPFVTEFAYIPSIFHGEYGYKLTLTDSQMNYWIDNIIRFIHPILKKVPLFVFSADDWPNSDEGRRTGFGFWNKPSIIETYRDLNNIFKMENSMPLPLPTRESLGTPVEGVITSVPNVYVNIRSNPDPTSTDIGDLHKGDLVCYRPNPLFANGYTWYALEEPIVGWFTNLAKVGIPINQIPRVSQNIPYISQENSDSNKFRNDCGVASLLMVEDFCLMNSGLHLPTVPTVNELASHSSLTARDYYLSFADLIHLAKLSGFDLAAVQGMTLDKIAEYLRNGIAPIILVSYSPFNPGHGDFTHFCVPTAYNDQVFWINDPYLGGQGYQIIHEQLDRALTDVTRFGNQPYQGLVITN